jgi:hypothetical protein
VAPSISEEKRRSAPPVYIDKTSSSAKALSHIAQSSITPSKNCALASEAPLYSQPIAKCASVSVEAPLAETSVFTPFTKTFSFWLAESYTPTTWYQLPATIELAGEETEALVVNPARPNPTSIVDPTLNQWPVLEVSLLAIIA